MPSNSIKSSFAINFLIVGAGYKGNLACEQALIVDGRVYLVNYVIWKKLKPKSRLKKNIAA